eukprot:4114129-Amphidinium_carterae.1
MSLTGVDVCGSDQLLLGNPSFGKLLARALVVREVSDQKLRPSLLQSRVLLNSNSGCTRHAHMQRVDACRLRGLLEKALALRSAWNCPQTSSALPCCTPRF